MTEQSKKVLSGYLLDETITFSLEEFSVACTAKSTQILELVDEGIIEPESRQKQDWKFSADTLRRAHKAIRLQRDLEINLAGVALILDLLEEVEALRARVKTDD